MAHILIVDDQRSIAHLWARGFQQLNYEVATAYGGVQAIAHMEEHGLPDLLLLDQFMRRGHGYEVVEALERLDPQKQVVVFMVTAEPEVYREKFEKRAAQVLHKPVLFRELMALVQEAVPPPASAASAG